MNERVNTKRWREKECTVCMRMRERKKNLLMMNYASRRCIPK